eukprot:Skav202874  [mRNA]  locus=scaffold3541:138236:140648:- [translate_table: standard]
MLAVRLDISCGLVADQGSSKVRPVPPRTGQVKSKGIATYQAGDALSGAATVPIEKGMTIMSYPAEVGKPELDGVMIPRANGTTLVDALNNGLKWLVSRAEWISGV